ncbi:MAG: hypothetical protein AAFV19_18440 [Pseudomonadota bacterium]
MKLAYVFAIGAVLLAGCKKPGTSVSQQAAEPGPVGLIDQWQLWYVDNNGYTREQTETSDWWQARVQGSNGTTLIAECNGNDPTAFNLSIEQRQGRFTAMTAPFAIEVLSARSGSFFREASSGVADISAPFPIDYEASLGLSAAMRKGNEIVFIFQGEQPVRYSLRGSSRIMNQMGCDQI